MLPVMAAIHRWAPPTQPGLPVKAQHHAARSFKLCPRRNTAARFTVGEADTQPSPLLNNSVVRLLQTALAEAVQAEDFATAAILRDGIRGLDPLAQVGAAIAALKEQLEAAIAAERFEEAAGLRDRLFGLLGERLRLQHANGEPGALAPADVAPAALPLLSDTVTNGIRVQAWSRYIPWQSDPDSGHYVFGCTIRITNEGPATVQLKRCYWSVTDGELGTREVRGPGALGLEPVLFPGQWFEYEPACPLHTPAGSLEGLFEMWTLCAGSAGLEAGWGEPFAAAIGRVGLRCEDPAAGQQGQAHGSA